MQLFRHARLATMTPDRPWGWVDDGAFIVHGGTLRWVGEDKGIPSEHTLLAEHDLWGLRVHDVRATCDALAVWERMSVDEKGSG